MNRRANQLMGSLMFAAAIIVFGGTTAQAQTLIPQNQTRPGDTTQWTATGNVQQAGAGVQGPAFLSSGNDLLTSDSSYVMHTNYEYDVTYDFAPTSHLDAGSIQVAWAGEVQLYNNGNFVAAPDQGFTFAGMDGSGQVSFTGFNGYAGSIQVDNVQITVLSTPEIDPGSCAAPIALSLTALWMLADVRKKRRFK